MCVALHDAKMEETGPYVPCHLTLRLFTFVPAKVASRHKHALRPLSASLVTSQESTTLSD